MLNDKRIYHPTPAPKRLMLILTGVGLALPTIGMIVGGFTSGSQLVECIGIGACLFFSGLYWVSLSMLYAAEVNDGLI